MKQTLLFIASLLIALPLVTNAEEAVVDGIRYKLNETKMTAEAAGLVDSTIMDLVIPASIKVEENEYQVVSIGYNAFNDNHFSSITFSEGLKTIDRVAFMFSWKVEKIILPNSVESVGASAFQHSRMKTLVFGKGIKTIESFAICSLPDLKEMYIYAQQMPEIAPWESDFPDESHWYDVKLYVPEELVEDYRQYKSTLPNFDEIKDENVLPITKDYESFLSSINAIESDPGNAVYYSLDGRRLKSPQKGINIIRQSDGTTRKVIVK